MMARSRLSQRFCSIFSHSVEWSPVAALPMFAYAPSSPDAPPASLSSSPTFALPGPPSSPDAYFACVTALMSPAPSTTHLDVLDCLLDPDHSIPPHDVRRPSIVMSLHATKSQRFVTGIPKVSSARFIDLDHLAFVQPSPTSRLLAVVLLFYPLRVPVIQCFVRTFFLLIESLRLR